MVGAINPTSAKPLSTYMANSKAAQYQLSPGEPFPGETVNKPNSSPKNNSHDTLSTGAIVGISLGAVAAVVLFGLVFYWLGKWRNQKSGPSTPKEVAERQSQGLLRYNQPGAHEILQYGDSGSGSGAGAGVQQVSASYYDYSRGDARIGSYYAPPNMLHVGSVYLSPTQGCNPESDKSSPAELGGQSFTPVELAVGERAR